MAEICNRDHDTLDSGEHTIDRQLGWEWIENVKVRSDIEDRERSVKNT